MNRIEISDWMLERYLLKEFPEKKIRKIEEFMKNDPNLQRRLQELKISDQKILEDYPISKALPEILGRYNKEKLNLKRIDNRWKSIYKYLLPPSIAAAAIILFIIISPLENFFHSRDITDGGHEVTRVKGSPAQLYIYRKKYKRIELLKSGSIARESDLLQIAYSTAEASYGVVLSIDGRGTVTLHYPKAIGDKAIIEKDKKIFLAHSYELDDAPLFEKFFLITSKKEINVDDIYRAAKKFARNPKKASKESLKIKEELYQTSVIIVKGK